jgi:hypothetical protein
MYVTIDGVILFIEPLYTRLLRSNYSATAIYNSQIITGTC